MFSAKAKNAGFGHLRLIILIIASSLLAACQFPAELAALGSQRLAPTATAESDWRRIADGLSWRRLTPNDDELAQLIAVRIDPERYRFRALYRPGAPLSLAAWRELEPKASLIINANFFDRAGRALGLVVSDSRAFGASYKDRGGTFLVKDDQPAFLTYRSPHSLTSAGIDQAIQGFPLLVEDGEPAYFSAVEGERTRRTLIGRDDSGRILILVSPYLGLSLSDLSAYLASSDLNLDIAINLDGGGSTLLALPGAEIFQPSIDAVPTVLVVVPR